MAELNDLDPLLRLERRCFERPWPKGAFAQELELPDAQIWLAFDADAERDADPVGYVDFWLVGGEVSILNVACDPERRRRGLGRSLLDVVIARATEAECHAVFLEVRRSNAAGLALYRAAGFHQVGIRKAYYADNNEDAIVMSRRLDSAQTVG